MKLIRLNSILNSRGLTTGEFLETEATIQLLRRSLLNWDFKSALKLVLILKRTYYKRSTILYQLCMVCIRNYNGLNEDSFNPDFELFCKSLFSTLNYIPRKIEIMNELIDYYIQHSMYEKALDISKDYMNSRIWRDSPLFISLIGVVLFNHWLNELKIFEDPKVKDKILHPIEGDFNNLNYYVINVKQKLPEVIPLRSLLNESKKCFEKCFQMKEFRYNQWLEQYVKVSITLGSLKSCYRVLKDLYKKDSKHFIGLSLLYQIEMGYYYEKSRWFILGINLLDTNPRINLSHGCQLIQHHYEKHGELYSVDTHLSVLSVIAKRIDETPFDIDFWRWLKKSLYIWKNMNNLDQFDKGLFSNIFRDRLNFWMNELYPHLIPYILKLAKFDYDIHSQLYQSVPDLIYLQIKCSTTLLSILAIEDS